MLRVYKVIILRPGMYSRSSTSHPIYFIPLLTTHLLSVVLPLIAPFDASTLMLAPVQSVTHMGCLDIHAQTLTRMTC